MNKYLIKIAEDLQPHQKDALKRLDKYDGVILDHSMGSGKTKTFLTAVARMHAKDPTGKALIIAPASLQTNVDQEIKKHGLIIDPKRLEVMSYERAVNDSTRLRKEHFRMVIADEAHKLRDSKTKRSKELTDIISDADKRILATGTMSYNKLSDIASVVNLAHGAKVLPEDSSKFEERYISKKLEQPPLLKRILGHGAKEVSSLKNTKELKYKLDQVVSHYDAADDPKAAENFPTKTEKIVEVEMSPEQHRIYKYLEEKLPWHLRLKVRMNLPLDKKESAALNAFSTGVRQASNSVSPYMPKWDKPTPKIHTAVKNLVDSANKDKDFRGLVYSNYLQAGLNDYSKELDKAGVQHSVYHGGLSRKEKDLAVEAYNSGKKPVLLISSSGGEGISLKGTRLVQVLEPHWNPSKINQTIGRAARYKSHEHLPESKRNVSVEHYHSVFPQGIMGKSKQHSIDQYLHENSKHKQDLSDQLKSLIKA